MSINIVLNLDVVNFNSLITMYLTCSTEAEATIVIVFGGEPDLSMRFLEYLPRC